MPVERVTRTIRLPAHLAPQVDQAADGANQSVNGWIISAIQHRLLAINTAVDTALTVQAHADRYPPVTAPTVGPKAPVNYHRPVGSFDPDTDGAP